MSVDPAGLELRSMSNVQCPGKDTGPISDPSGGMSLIEEEENRKVCVRMDIKWVSKHVPIRSVLL